MTAALYAGKLGGKVLVLGCPGSGKSTLAKELQRRTGLPLFHLDRIWWREDRTHISREDFDERLRTILQGESWIIDGDYSRTYEPRFFACDSVVFLDLDEETCRRGIAERIGQSRTDVPWTGDRFDPALEEQVASYRRENRPKLYALIAKYPEKRVFVFRIHMDHLRSFIPQKWGKGTQPPVARAAFSLKPGPVF